MAEQLQQDMECEGLLECIHGLKQLDKECFQVLVEGEGPLPIDEVADRVAREMRWTLNDSYTKLGQLVHEFERTYRDAIDDETAGEG